jgi:hypothetical protein
MFNWEIDEHLLMALVFGAFTLGGIMGALVY